MFHTPPINPERSQLSTTATLESYTKQDYQEEEIVKMGKENGVIATSPTVSTASPVTQTIEDPISVEDSSGINSSNDNKIQPPSSATNEAVTAATTPVSLTDTKEEKHAHQITLEYTRDLKTVNLPSKLSESIDIFLRDLQAPKYSKPLSTDQVAGLFQQFYHKFEARALTYLTAKETDEAVIGKIHNDYIEHMEATLCGNQLIFHKIYQNNLDDLKIQLKIYEKSFVLRNIIHLKLEQLDFDMEKFGNGFSEATFQNDLAQIEKSFNMSNYLKSPLEKLLIISNSFDKLIKLIYKYQNGGESCPNTSSGYINADIALPIFIYFIVHKHVENLFLNFKYIKRFRNSNFWMKDLGGGYSYDITNVEALLTFIINLDYQRDLNLDDDELKRMFNKFKSGDKHDDKDHTFNELKESKQLDPPKRSKLNNKNYNEKKKVVEELEQFNDEDANITFFDNLTFSDLQKLLSPLDLPLFQDVSIPQTQDPTTSSTNRPNRPKSNSMTFIKNTVQESLSYYHNSISPSSTNSSNSARPAPIMRQGSLSFFNNVENSGGNSKPLTLSEVSSGLVMNVADQGLKNLSSAFDNSLKFLGNKIASQNTNNDNGGPDLNPSNVAGSGVSLSSMLSGGRSRSNSGNSFMSNSRNRSNSTLNNVFSATNSIQTIAEAEITEGVISSKVDSSSTPDHNGQPPPSSHSHPLNKFIRWRSFSSSNLPISPSSSTTFPISAGNDVNSIGSADSNSGAGTSGTGLFISSPSSKKVSPKLFSGTTVAPKQGGDDGNDLTITNTNQIEKNAESFKKMDKPFDEMTMKELKQLYEDYNLLVGYIS
ncbi:hypothetical protein DASC09_024150 [Saccharomycopsis crataegensis]|uniref:VPS9 domain-containing protein n=1 Tax=Saccharomycopsis crataegensis TaxID=43959 RepID=A0AAV5QL62_9ASCO|nr:hypothetical protein DASC09_024150 [Saccharomycopsis crataegensis]